MKNKGMKADAVFDDNEDYADNGADEASEGENDVVNVRPPKKKKKRKGMAPVNGSGQGEPSPKPAKAKMDRLGFMQKYKGLKIE